MVNRKHDTMYFVFCSGTIIFHKFTNSDHYMTFFSNVHLSS